MPCPKICCRSQLQTTRRGWEKTQTITEWIKGIYSKCHKNIYTVHHINLYFRSKVFSNNLSGWQKRRPKNVGKKIVVKHWTKSKQYMIQNRSSKIFTIQSYNKANDVNRWINKENKNLFGQIKRWWRRRWRLFFVVYSEVCLGRWF